MRRKNKERIPTVKDRVKDREVVDDRETSSTVFLSSDDLVSIQQTLFSLQHQRHRLDQEPWGWSSPLKNTPHKALPLSPLVGSKHLYQIKWAKYKDLLTDPLDTPAVLLPSSTSSQTIAQRQLQEEEKGQNHLLRLSDGACRTSFQPCERVMRGYSRQQLENIPPRNEMDQLFETSMNSSYTPVRKENNLSKREGFTWSQSSAGPVELPLHILDKLRLAEQEYELGLTKIRRQEVTKLRQQLTAQSRQELEETRVRVDRECRLEQNRLLRSMEKFAQQLIVSHFGENSSSASHVGIPLTTIEENSIPIAVRTALEELVTKSKADIQEQLQAELRRRVIAAAQEVEARAAQNQQENAVMETVLRSFNSVAEEVKSCSASSLIRTAQSTVIRNSAGTAFTERDMAVAVEQARVQQIKIHRRLSQEVEIVRNNMQEL
eukprot:gene2726-2977_t